MAVFSLLRLLISSNVYLTEGISRAGILGVLEIPLLEVLSNHCNICNDEIEALAKLMVESIYFLTNISPYPSHPDSLCLDRGRGHACGCQHGYAQCMIKSTITAKFITLRLTLSPISN